MTNQYPSDQPLDAELCQIIVSIVRAQTADGEGSMSTRELADHLNLHTKQVQDSVRKPMNMLYLGRLGADITQDTYRSPWRWSWKPGYVADFMRKEAGLSDA